MSFKLILVLLWAGCLSSYGQSKLLLKNTKTGRQKEMARNSFIRISFSTLHEHVKVYHEGKVVSFTDSTLSYLPGLSFIPTFSLQRDTVTVALKSIRAIQQYKPVVSLGVAAGTGLVIGIVGGNVIQYPLPTILFASGTLLVLRAVETYLIYPMRRVNQANAVWQISVSP